MIALFSLLVAGSLAAQTQRETGLELVLPADASGSIDVEELIEGNDVFAPRAVIDFSADSIRNSTGLPIGTARAEVPAAGITIIALPILRQEDGRRAGANLEEEYANRIIGGPGAFMVTAEGRDRFAATVRRKLVLEISGITPEEQSEFAQAEG